jgi:hypothetical protein
LAIRRPAQPIIIPHHPLPPRSLPLSFSLSPSPLSSCCFFVVRLCKRDEKKDEEGEDDDGSVNEAEGEGEEEKKEHNRLRTNTKGVPRKMSSSVAAAAFHVSPPIAVRDLDPEDPTNAIQNELYSSWALLILVSLLIATLWMSYYLQLKKIRAVHETVVSIFGGICLPPVAPPVLTPTPGMIVGLVIRLSPGMLIQGMVSFKYSVFFNFLLPPIILNSGYELHQVINPPPKPPQPQFNRPR